MSHRTGVTVDRENFLRTLRSLHGAVPADESTAAAPLVAMLSRFTGTTLSAEPTPEPLTGAAGM